ncbi:MAG: penicillin-binding protein activator [Parvularculaceae bacterium]
MPTSRFRAAASDLRMLFAVAAIVLLAACASGPPSDGIEIARPEEAAAETPPGRPSEETSRYDRRGFLEPFHMDAAEPVRVGLLLPFTAPSETVQRVASAMFDAAQLAAFEAADRRFLLIPKDTKGNAADAAAAARSALADGAEILLGPLFAEEVIAVADVARAAGAPMIAFSSDLKSGGDGIYLLSFPPEIEIARVTEYAVLNGLSRFGLIAPATDFGERVTNAFAEEIFVRGGVLVHVERYEQNPDAMLAPAKRLAEYAEQTRPANPKNGAPPPLAPRDPAEETTIGRGFQAVLMPEQGTLLRALAPLLPYYNVDINQIRLLGISAWNNPRLAREPALRGGWFAAPDPAITKNFADRYAAAFGQAPPRLASLSYDATLLAAKLAQGPRRRERFDLAAIADPNGYFGADGLFRFKEDGSVERGLAILEIQPGGIQVIDPAPKSFATGY